jgi:environmental stress-induced protein Ves
MDVIRSTAYRRMPWRNGLGETAEIAISPAGAALDRFEWRISMATIAAAGPFSAFAGIDRTLTVLSGAGFRLVLDGQPAVALTPRSPPLSFRGESEASAQLVGGPVTDLNVMTRRDRCWHRVRRCAPGARLPFEAAAATAAVFCVTGPVSVEAAGGALELGALDTLLIDAPRGALRAGGGATGSLLLIEIGRL